MRNHEDKRPPEFLAVLKALPARLQAIKQLQLKGEDSLQQRHLLTYGGSTVLTLSTRDRNGKEVLYYKSDRRSSLTRIPGKRLRRGKPGELPDLAPTLVAVLLKARSLTDYGLPAEGDFERTYEVSKKKVKNRSVLRLGYRGADSIGRDQTGDILFDEKSGIPVSFEESQSGNSPRDDGEYSNWESWTIISVK